MEACTVDRRRMMLAEIQSMRRPTQSVAPPKRRDRGSADACGSIGLRLRILVM
jgi:hypothetical protein